MATLVSMFERVRKLYGSQIAIVDEAGNLNWSQFVERISRAASLLSNLGLAKGDRYGIISTNSFQQAELIYAGYWNGCIPVPVNFRLAPREIAEILDDAGCKYLILEDAFADLLLSNEMVSYKDKVLFLSANAQSTLTPSYDAELANCDPLPPQCANEGDLAILIYTGGTTGRSKGVCLTHRNIFANGMQLDIALRIKSNDVYLHVAPMFHSADFIGTGFTHVGAAHAYLAAPSTRSILEAIENYRITKLMLPPSLIIAMLQDPDLDNFNLSSLRCILYGSAPMAVEWIRKMMKTIPQSEIVQGYGLSETSPILTTLDHEAHLRGTRTEGSELLKSAGRPVVGVDLKIVGNNQQEVSTGNSGEVAVRGANVASGYHNLPEANAHTFRNGWLYTGDIGSVDDEGYLYLLDRKKDMIVTGSENVYSTEVENALYQHPNVHEAAVIGIPDEKYGEAIFAVIVPKPGEVLTENEIIAHCRDRIGGYKIPRKMTFVDELPKSAVGKILKTELRKKYRDGCVPVE